MKHFTELEHRQTEDALLPKIVSISSPEDYHALLSCFYSYFQPVESLIEQYIDATILTDISRRRKAYTILKDLDNGLLPELCTSLPEINNTAAAFGALYVLEGSTLGGKGIARMLRKNNEFISEANLHFFNGYGAETGFMWTNFLQALNAYPSSPVEQDIILQAANYTFHHFRKHILNTLY